MFHTLLENHQTLLAVLEIISTTLTPLLIGFFGWRITTRLKQSKMLYLREKEWGSKWADTFYSSARSFNKAVEDLACLVYQINEHSKFSTNLEVHQRIVAEKKIALFAACENIQQFDWALNTDVQFAPNNLAQVTHASKRVLEIAHAILKKGTTDLDELHHALSAFNKVAKNAHRELLTLADTKTPAL